MKHPNMKQPTGFDIALVMIGTTLVIAAAFYVAVPLGLAALGAFLIYFGRA
jgi:hypothetical protein